MGWMSFMFLGSALCAADDMPACLLFPWAWPEDLTQLLEAPPATALVLVLVL
jgi:hypothetical protein